MELKPGYKQTDVGVIPEEWEIHTIGDSMHLINGRAFKPEDWKERGLPIVRIQNLNDTESAFNYFSGPVEDRHRIQAGDLLFAWSGTTGTSFGARIWSGPTAVLNQHIFKVIPDEKKLTPSYALLVLRKVQENIEKQAHGFKASFVHVKKSDLVGVQLPLPRARAEQEAIAEALSDADALIESLEQLIAKKRHLKQGAMQELLTGKKRLPEFEVKHGYKQTEVGVIPEDWEVMTLGSLCEIAAGHDLVKDDFSPTGDHRHQFPIYSNALTNKGLYGYSKSYQYEPDKITVTARGDIGHAVHRSTRFSAIGRLLVLSSKRSSDLRLVSEYINHFVDFALESTGVPQLTAPQISQYTVALPPSKAEQEAIATILSDMDAEVAALEAKLAKARQLKQGMMQELLTGRIRLV